MALAPDHHCHHSADEKPCRDPPSIGWPRSHAGRLPPARAHELPCAGDVWCSLARSPHEKSDDRASRGQLKIKGAPKFHWHDAVGRPACRAAASSPEAWGSDHGRVSQGAYHGGVERRDVRHYVVPITPRHGWQWQTDRALDVHCVSVLRYNSGSQWRS